MQTVDKALSLLNLFSERRAAIGLSELSRLSGFNKATVRRFLIALEKHGFVEQDATSRAYRLGPALLRLARVREAVSPVTSIVQPILEGLVAELGETAHFSLYAGGSLATVGLVESTKANRVMLEKGEAIPLHATASGLAYLGFARAETLASALDRPLCRYSPETVTDPRAIRELLERVRRNGIAIVKGTYEDGVCGIASPVFAEDGFSCGAVAIAAPESRARRQELARMRPSIRRAAAAATRAMGAEPNAAVLASAAA